MGPDEIFSYSVYCCESTRPCKRLPCSSTKVGHQGSYLLQRERESKCNGCSLQLQRQRYSYRIRLLKRTEARQNVPIK